jgi:hypothetical protein
MYRKWRNLSVDQGPKSQDRYGSNKKSQPPKQLLCEYKNYMLVFPLETRLKLQLTTEKKSHSLSWNKGRCDDGFEVHWVTWTELKVAWGCARIFSAAKRDKQQLDKASRQSACFTTENLLVSLKTSWKKHSQKCLLSLQNLFKVRKQASSKFLSSWYCSP